jgi:hypothetical protein
MIITFNIKEFHQGMNELQRTLIPRAISAALTKTAVEAKQDLNKRLMKGTLQGMEGFDRPNPFTQGAFGVVPASDTATVSEVFVKKWQADYLRFQLADYPGEVTERFSRGMSGGWVLTPAAGWSKAEFLDAFGGIPRRYLKRLRVQGNVSEPVRGKKKRRRPGPQAKAHYFFREMEAGNAFGTEGWMIMRRENGSRNAKAVIFGTKKAKQRAKMPFKDIVMDSAQQRFTKNVEIAMAEAFRAQQNRAFWAGFTKFSEGMINAYS